MYKKLATFTLFFLGLFTLINIYFISHIQFDYNFEKFFPVNDPELEYYLEFRETFENDNDYLLIGLENHPSVFDKTFLEKTDALGEALRKLPDVEQVLSPTELKRLIYSPTGWIQIPLLHWRNSSRYTQDSTLIFSDNKYVGNFFAPNSHSLSLLLKHTQMIPKQRADQLAQSVEETIQKLGFTEYHIAGKAQAQGNYVTRMQKEFALFLSISIVLVIIFLIITYRAVWAVIVPLSVVLLSVIWILGFMGLIGQPLDVMLVLMPTILFVVGMSDVVHILSKYLEELRKGYSKITALKTSFKDVGLATLLTSLTTSVGFLTLLTASIQPIQNFGVIVAVGVFIAYFMAFTLLPAVLLFIRKPKITEDKALDLKWKNFLGFSFGVIRRRSNYVLIISLLITLVSLFGMSRIEINTFLLEDIPKNDPLKKDFLFFDKNYGGSRPFEMAVWVKDSSRTLYDPSVLKELNKIEHYLSISYGAKNLISPVFIIKSLNQGYKGGQPYHYQLPESSSILKRSMRLIKKLEKREDFTKVTTKDHRYGRFSGRMGDIGSSITLEKNEELRHFMQQNINQNLLGYHLTGTSLLIDKNNELLAANMVQGLGIAFLVIALITGLMFRSIRMIFITLIPNIIPLLMVAGIMGFFNINLKLSTSIIFTIAFGIAVDDTIHFISKFRLELKRGKDKFTALKNTYFSTGKAIILTSIILSGGFMVLILSSFGGTFYTGLLVSLTLLFALVIDLSLLPVLILLFYKK